MDQDTRPNDVRARILDAATRLFYTEGIQAVGIQRLIDEAGIAKASLYAHFKSKDDVVAAYLDGRGEAWRERIRTQVIERDLTPRQRILALFDELAAWVAGPSFRGCPFENAAGEFGAACPGREVTEHHRRWLKHLLRKWAKEAGAQDPETVTAALLVLHDGAAASALVDREPSRGRAARWSAEALLDAATRPQK